MTPAFQKFLTFYTKKTVPEFYLPAPWRSYRFYNREIMLVWRKLYIQALIYLDCVQSLKMKADVLTPWSLPRCSAVLTFLWNWVLGHCTAPSTLLHCWQPRWCQGFHRNCITDKMRNLRPLRFTFSSALQHKCCLGYSATTSLSNQVSCIFVLRDDFCRSGGAPAFECRFE